MVAVSLLRLFCSFAAVYPDIASDPKCANIAPKSTSTLRTFTFLPSIAPAAAIPKDTLLQFNGSAPAELAAPGQLGWWTKGVGGKGLVNLNSFVQYNADSGVVFWTNRTRFEWYLSEVTKKTYAVKLGQPTPTELAGNWTISKIPEEQKYGFGWEGDYKSWFVCEGKGGDAGYYGLYFGEKLYGCGDYFDLNVKYD